MWRSLGKTFKRCTIVLKTQPKLTTTSKSAEPPKRRNAYCVCCERPFNPKSLPIHHEGKEKIEIPVCPPCHWALHYGNLEIRQRMKGKIHAWLRKQQK